ncbi:hypothetical protein B0J13DRAFT_647065, partial [Dactylonectria estremocensis]
RGRIVALATGYYSGTAAELVAQIGCRVIAPSRTAMKLDVMTRRHPRITAPETTGDVEKDTVAIQALSPNGAGAFFDVSPPVATASPHHLLTSFNALRSGARVIFLGSMGDLMDTRVEFVTLINMIEMDVVRLRAGAGHEVMDAGFAWEDWEKASAVAEKATR